MTSEIGRSLHVKVSIWVYKPLQNLINSRLFVLKKNVPDMNIFMKI